MSAAVLAVRPELQMSKERRLALGVQIIRLIEGNPAITDAMIRNALHCTAAERDLVMAELRRVGQMPPRVLAVPKVVARDPHRVRQFLAVRCGLAADDLDLLFEGPSAERLGPVLREAVVLVRAGTPLGKIEGELGLAARSGKEVMKIAAAHLRELVDG